MASTAKTRLILDRGCYDFEGWSRLIAQHSQFIGAAKSNLAYRVTQPLSLTPGLKDRLIQVSLKTPDQTGLTLRLIEVRGRQGWYRYLTSVLDPEVLPPYVVIDLYARRWRIEILQPQYPHSHLQADAEVAELKRCALPWVFSSQEFEFIQVKPFSQEDKQCWAFHLSSVA